MNAVTTAIGEPDLVRLRRTREGRLQEQLEHQGIDALLALHGPHVGYASGVLAVAADVSHASFRRPVALVVRGDDQAHVFTDEPDLVPDDHPDDHVHPALWVELDEGVDDLARAVGDLVGTGAGRVLAVDEITAAMHRAGGRWHAEAELVDAGRVFGPVKLCKSPDELACIARAQAINNESMLAVYDAVVPGARQSDLTGRFLRRVHELGATANVIDPIWEVMEPTMAHGPWTTTGDLAFPTVTTDRILRRGDIVWVDTGVTYQGYASDFGRTWVVGHDEAPPSLVPLFRRWCDVVDAVLDAVAPGVSAGELVRRAVAAGGGTASWLPHFYLSHAVGIESAEPPLIGTDLGPDVDDATVLAPGMVLVLEPATWEDGVGGYRAEEIVAVTDDGWVGLSGQHPYAPFVR